jgi:hypothetical protein
MMRRRDRASLAVRGYFTEMRHEFSEMRQVWAQIRAEWRELIAMIRAQREHVREMRRVMTGKAEPTRREVRRAEKAIGAEVAELEAIERRVTAEHEQEDGQQLS